jgi:uncharacterized iron-regulated membrane protein
MTPRRVLFWIHLTASCVAGLVILVMSVTGILLAYKRQIVNWADRGFRSHSAPQPQHLPVDDLLAKLQAIQGQRPSDITFRSDKGAPVGFDFGRERTLFVDSYTGQLLGEESPKLRGFFSEVENLHRWLGARADGRATGRAITGACNLSFLMLVVTGPILWWPKEWTRRNLKKITVLRGGPWGRARDWNWHNVLGFWCVAPLFLIVLTGVIMSYGWANNLLYRMTGNIPPPPGPAAGQNRPDRDSRQDKNHALEQAPPGSLEKLFVLAAQQVPAWTTISLRLPDARQDTSNFSIDQGNGGRPDLRSQLTLDIQTGHVVGWEPFSSYNRGRQLRSWARFTHTGEAFGAFGQTVAAMVSAGAGLLIFTGLSLALRRLAGWKSRCDAKPEVHEVSTVS